MKYSENERKRQISRRYFLEQCGVGMGALALHQLLSQSGYAESNPLAPKKPHFAPKAKNVIYLFMAGGPSHIEMFDYKPQLAKFDGTLPPQELLKGYRAAFINPNSKLLGPKFKFAKYGQAGAEISELLPYTARIVDDITIVKSMVTDAFNHAPGQLMMNTGAMIFGRPSFGSWRVANPGTCRRLLPSAQVPKGLAAATVVGAAASCRPSIKGCNSAMSATRSCIFQTRVA
jgi:hypothetical protein